MRKEELTFKKSTDIIILNPLMVTEDCLRNFRWQDKPFANFPYIAVEKWVTGDDSERYLYIENRSNLKKIGELRVGDWTMVAALKDITKSFELPEFSENLGIYAIIRGFKGTIEYGTNDIIRGYGNIPFEIKFYKERQIGEGIYTLSY